MEHPTEGTLTGGTSKCGLKQFMVEKLDRENDSLLKISNMEKNFVEGGCVNNNVVLGIFGSKEETIPSDNNVDRNNGFKKAAIENKEVSTTSHA